MEKGLAVVPMPNAPPTSYKVAQFHQWYKGGQLELAPPFQRKPVWSIRNKTFLIDTILNDLPIPEIYIQVKTDKDGRIKYVVVDGQQRIRAILGFIEGDYALSEEEIPAYADKTFTDLSDEEKSKIWAFPLVTRELATDSVAEIKNIFVRLNKYVVPLNDQELRNATYGGYFIQLVNKLAEDEFWADNKIVTPNEIKRMKDVEYISELLIAMIHGVQQKDQEQINNYYKLYDEKFIEREDKRKEVEAVEKDIKSIFKDDLVKTRWHGKADFYSLFLTLYELNKSYYLPPDRLEKVKDCLVTFGAEVDKAIRTSASHAKPLIHEYIENVEKQTTHKATRQKRCDIIRKLLIPFLVAKDSKRAFTEEERRIAWDSSPNHVCALCNEAVQWDNYELDHKLPHSKGGKTELHNAQVTHKECNGRKSNKVAT